MVRHNDSHLALKSHFTVCAYGVSAEEKVCLGGNVSALVTVFSAAPIAPVELDF